MIFIPICKISLLDEFQVLYINDGFFFDEWKSQFLVGAKEAQEVIREYQVGT